MRHRPQGTGVCTTTNDDHECYDFSGNNQSQVPGLAAHLDIGITQNTFRELFYNGKTFFPTGLVAHTTVCWDWTTGSGCSKKVWTNTGDYGYVNEGNCIIALGHDNKFWSFDENMNAGGCSTVSLRTKIFPCGCIGTSTNWGTISFRDIDFKGTDWAKFVIHVELPSGNELFQKNLLGTDGKFELTDIPAGTPWVEVWVEAGVRNKVAFGGGPEPSMMFKVTSAPALVD